MQNEDEIFDQKLRDIGRIIWSHCHGRSVAEIARSCGMGEKAVANLLGLNSKDKCINPGVRSLITVNKSLDITMTDIEYELDYLTLAVMLLTRKLVVPEGTKDNFIISERFMWQIREAAEKLNLIEHE